MEKVMYDLKDLLKREIQKVVDKNDISPSEMQNVCNAVCTMEKICKIEQIENDMYSMDRSGKKFYMSYDNDMSGRRMRGPDGRFTGSYDYPMHVDPMMRHDYEHDRSNHSIEDRMVDSLEKMMDNAGSEYERQQIQAWIHKMRTSEMK